MMPIMGTDASQEEVSALLKSSVTCIQQLKTVNTFNEKPE